MCIRDSLGIAPEMLLRRRDIEALVMQAMAGEPLDELHGWRGVCLGQDLQRALEEASE